MIYNIFVSHSWKYQEQYKRLKELLGSDIRFTYKDYSVPEDNPIKGARTDAELKEAIERKMRPCSCILILGGVYATYSKWINIEIELAKEMGKKIIAVEVWGSQRMSSHVREAADEIVGWNTNSIVKAITK